MTIKNRDRNVIVLVMALVMVLVMVLVEHNGNGVFFSSGPAESRGGGEEEDGEKGKSQEGKKVG